MQTSQYFEYIVSLDSVQNLKGQLRVNVTLAAEMVQPYHISEVPWLAEKLSKDVEFVKVFKPFEELKKSIQDLESRDIKQIPFVMPHSYGTFMESQLPERLAKYKDKFEFEYVKDEQIVGWVREFYFDEITRKIKGWLYLPTSSEDSEYLQFIADVIAKKVVNVSIGFICDWAGAGEYNGVGYTLTQVNIQIGHLAGLVNAQGKCPAGICGINQDSHVDHIDYTHLQLHKTINGKNYEFVTDEIIHIIPEIIADCLCKNKIILDQTSKNGVQSNGLISTDRINENQEVFLMESEEEKKKRLEEEEKKKKEKEASASKDSEIIKDLIAETHGLKLKLDIAEKTIADQSTKLSEKDSKLKVYEDQDRAKYTELLGGKDAVIIGRKVSDMCLHDLQFAATYKQELADKAIAGNLPMPNQDQFIAKRDPNVKIEALTSSGMAFNGKE